MTQRISLQIDTGLICLLLAGLLGLAACKPAENKQQPAAGNDGLRIATFNVAMGLAEQGQLGQALKLGEDPRLRQLAEILQRLRPDIIVLNEFDYDPPVPAAALFNLNFLAAPQNKQAPIQYHYSYRAPVNTGLDSKMDLDQDGITGEPEDAWGFGRFPGQFGMLVLSRYPILADEARTFRTFKWADMPGAMRPRKPDGSEFYPDEVWHELRLSSKNHLDLPVEVRGKVLHLLLSHPTPSVFDGPEDRNGTRNFDENRFWVEYISGDTLDFIRDDEGNRGGLDAGAAFVIGGDLNADPFDGSSVPGSTKQLLEHPLIDASCTALSKGGVEAAMLQGGINAEHEGDPAADTSDFNDEYAGNLRLDYLLPRAGLALLGCGVFWPAADEDGHGLVEVSDHRLVWLDISL
jgi:hypothetical protein